MKIAVETITPEQAAELLAKSVDRPNRKINRTRVLRFAHAIHAGQWKVTHQGVAIDPDGLVLDGQHRLSAIVEAKLPVEMTVARDVDPAAFGVIDTGAARSATDTVTMAGYANSTALAALSRFYMAYDQVKGTKTTLNYVSKLLTSMDVLEFVQSEKGARAVEQLNRSGNVANSIGRFGVRTWLTAGFLAIEDAGASRELLYEFQDRIADGAMLRADSSILWFRHWLINENGYSRLQPNLRATSGLSNLITAFNMWVAGIPQMHTFAPFRTGVSVMPVPNPFPHLNQLDIPKEEEEPIPTEAQQIDIQGNVTQISTEDAAPKKGRKRA